MNAMDKFCEVCPCIMLEAKGQEMKHLYCAFHVSETISRAFHGFFKMYFSI